MAIIFNGQSFAAADWGAATITGATTATVTQGFGFAINVSGTLTGSGTLTVTEQNAAHTVLALSSVNLGSAGAFVLQDAAGNDFVISNTAVGIGDQLPVSAAGLLAYQPPACFAAGTKLLTPRGPIAVETLRVGDALTTAAGLAKPVVWIGHRKMRLAGHPRPQDVHPVRVLAHAFAPGVPWCDVQLSPDHAVYADGVLIPVRYLCNGRTIRQEPARAITYYHVELAQHDIVLAAGLPSESYLDTGNRSAFSNGGKMVLAHPSFGPGRQSAKGYAPRVLRGPVLRHVRQRLLVRAAALGHALTVEPAFHLVVGDAIVKPERFGHTYVFRLAVPNDTARLVSRTAIPAETLAGSGDFRALGVAVGALVVNGESIAPGDPRRTDGWLPPERAWQWTDGEATLECRGAREIAVTLLPIIRYWRTKYWRTPMLPPPQKTAPRPRRIA